MPIPVSLWTNMQLYLIVSQFNRNDVPHRKGYLSQAAAFRCNLLSFLVCERNIPHVKSHFALFDVTSISLLDSH